MSTTTASEKKKNTFWTDASKDDYDVLKPGDTVAHIDGHTYGINADKTRWINCLSHGIDEATLKKDLPKLSMAGRNAKDPKPIQPVFTVQQTIAIDKFIHYMIDDVYWTCQTTEYGSDLNYISSWTCLLEEWDQMKHADVKKTEFVKTKKEPKAPQLNSDEAAAVNLFLGYMRKRTDWRERNLSCGDIVFADDRLWNPLIGYWNVCTKKHGPIACLFSK
jgi:hypothetical protein